MIRALATEGPKDGFEEFFGSFTPKFQQAVRREWEGQAEFVFRR
jgi:hypothetical protein